MKHVGKCTIHGAYDIGYFEYFGYFPHFFFLCFFVSKSICGMAGQFNEEECRAKVLALEHLGVSKKFCSDKSGR